MIDLDDLPLLRDPLMIVACEGWNDAGESATDALEHLARQWDAEPVADLHYHVMEPRTLRLYAGYRF